MRTRGQSCAFWCGLLVVFLLALLPRLVYPVSRPMQWYTRSARFWDALLTGDLSGTYQQYHPGVTTMWIAGFGLRVYAAAHGWSPAELLDPPRTSPGLRRYPVGAGVAALGVVISLCVCLVYVLLTQLLGWRTGIVGGFLLALDPFYLTYSKVLHVDAMLASLMLVSALFLVAYLQRRSWLLLVLSGVFAGLAFLTKSPSGFLIPYAVLVMAYRYLRHGRDSADLSWIRVWASRLGRIARDLVMWGLVAACVFILLWPAMWIMPREALSEMAQRILFHVETPHRNPGFFAGRVVYGDLGPFFYLVTIAWKTTLVTLPASFAVLFFLLWRAKRSEDGELLWWVLLYTSGFTAAMMVAARKEPRYLLPTFPALDVLAAWGLVQVAGAMGRSGRLRKWAWVSTAIIAIVLTVQAGAVLRHHPYYGTHYNLLLGGSRVAQHILPFGEQAEGVDLAARFLNNYPGAELMTVGVQERNSGLFKSNFVGSARPLEGFDVDYWLFAVNPVQRTLDVDQWGEIWEACEQAESLWSVSFGGVPYVWIYRAYPHDPDAFDIEHPLDVQVGDRIRLLGYRLSSSEPAAGDPVTTTLFWQSDGRVTGDYHVFVHLLDAEGTLVAQHDGVPVEGERPTWGWLDAEVLVDEHTLVIGDDLPGGVHSLFVGMYELQGGARLPAFNSVGERLPEDRIWLDVVRLPLP